MNKEVLRFGRVVEPTRDELAVLQRRPLSKHRLSAAVIDTTKRAFVEGARDLIPKIPHIIWRWVLRARYLPEEGENPSTLASLSHNLGVTKEDIRQIEQRGLTSLRKLKKGEPLCTKGKPSAGIPRHIEPDPVNPNLAARSIKVGNARRYLRRATSGQYVETAVGLDSHLLPDTLAEETFPPLSSSYLTTRARNALLGAGFTSLQEVDGVSDEELLVRCDDLGAKSLLELRQALASLKKASEIF